MVFLRLNTVFGDRGDVWKETIKINDFSARLNRSRVYWFIAAAEVLGRVQLISKLNSNLCGAEITSNFSTYK